MKVLKYVVLLMVMVNVLNANALLLAVGITNGSLKTKLVDQASNDNIEYNSIDTKGYFIEAGYGQVIDSQIIRNMKYTIYFDDIEPSQNRTDTQIYGIGGSVEIDFRVDYISPFFSANLGRYKLENSMVSSVATQDFSGTSYGVKAGLLYAFAPNAELGLVYKLQYIEWGDITVNSKSYRYTDNIQSALLSVNVFF